MIDSLSQVPAELKSLPQWCTWRYEFRDGKQTKPPVNPHTGVLGDSCDPKKWAPFEVAIVAWKSKLGGAVGVGFVFADGDPYAGVDLDKCRNPQTGVFEPWAQEVVDRALAVGAYVEISPSKCGVKIITRGRVPGPRHRKDQVEMYDKERYFTVTGNVIGQSPKEIGEGQQVLDWLYEKTFGANGGVEASATGANKLSLEDQKLIKRAMSAKNGAAFKTLWAGDTTAYGGDDSRADLALLSHLAFWTRCDAARMDRLFRCSGLMRGKWDREDYRSGSINKAIESNRRPQHVVPEVVSPPFAQLPWIPLPVEVLPELSRQFVIETAMALGCDPAMVAVPHLAALASCIGNSRRIRLKSTWAEPAVIWGVLVAPSGTLKSPALEAVIAPIRKQQETAFREHGVKLKDHETVIAQWKRQEKKWRDDGRGDPPIQPEAPICRRYLVTDVTVEGLVAVLADNPRGLLLARDELSGFVGAFDAYKRSRDSDRAAYLEMHRAGAVTIDRKTGLSRVLNVPRAAVSIAGTIQPSILRRVLTDDYFSCGFAARCLATMPPTPPKVWTDDKPSTVDISLVLERLLTLEMVMTEAGPAPVDIPLSPEALEVWRNFYNAHNEEAETLDENERAAWSKIEGYVPRFALIFRLVRNAGGGFRGQEFRGQDSIFIEPEDIEAAVTLGRWFGHETRRVYAALRESPDAAEVKRIIAIIERQGGVITASGLCKLVRRFKDSPQGTELAQLQLDALAAAGLGVWLPSEGPGRPTTHFKLHTVPESPIPKNPRDEFRGFGDKGPDSTEAGPVGAP